MEPVFKCRVCGSDTLLAPNPPEQAVCPEHCEDHEYEHDPWVKRHVCIICGQEAPDDYYIENDVREL